MATAIPKACLASSAIRCRDVETGPNFGVLAVFPSNGATCRCPLPSTGSRGLNSTASAVSGRRRRPPKGWPPSAAQTVRAVFRHTAFTRVPVAERWKVAARSGEQDHTRRRACARGESGSPGIATAYSDGHGYGSGRPGSLLTLAPTDPDVRVLPHPAPRQTASLRAVAYPRVQEARRWPPPSLRLVWPGRLSGVVTWRRDPPAVCWPSFPPPVPPTGAPFPPRGRVGSIPPLRRCRVGGGAHRRARLRPPLKRYVRFSRIPLSQGCPGGREMEGINEWTFCSPVGVSQSASLLGRSLLGLSHKELIRAIGLTHSRPAVSPTTLPTDFPSPPGCRSRGRTAFTARQVLFGRPTPRTTSPSTSPSDL